MHSCVLQRDLTQGKRTAAYFKAALSDRTLNVQTSHLHSHWLQEEDATQRGGAHDSAGG